MPPPKALSRSFSSLRELIETISIILGEDVHESDFCEKNGGKQFHLRLEKHSGGLSYYPKSGKAVADGKDATVIAEKLSGPVSAAGFTGSGTPAAHRGASCDGTDKPNLLEAPPVEGVSSTSDVDEVLLEIGEGDWKWTEVYKNTLWVRQSLNFDAVMELDRTCNSLNFMGPQASRLRGNYLAASRFVEPARKRSRIQEGLGSQVSVCSIPDSLHPEDGHGPAPPPANLPNLMLTFDGGSQGEQSSAGSGAALYRQDGTGRLDEIAAWSLKLGPGRTNNEAEYEALCMGLDKVKELIEEPANLVIQGDSSLVIHQMGPSQWKVNKPELRRLKERADSSVNELSDHMNVTWVHKLRRHNKRADELATFGSQQPGEEPLELANFFNAEFYGEIKIGTPGQTFRVVYDTGSSTLWVPGRRCKSAACRRHRRFAESRSATSRSAASLMSDSKLFPIHYGTGDVKLQRETDKIEVTFGSIHVHQQVYQVANVTVPQVTFGVSIGESRFPFATSPADGICGLGFTEPEDPFGLALIDLSAAFHTLGFYYSFDPRFRGSLSVGSVEHKRIERGHSILWSPVEAEWIIPMVDIAVNGHRLHLCNTTCPALVDTGTSLIVGPVESIVKLTDAIETDNCVGPNITILIQGETPEVIHQLPLTADQYYIFNTGSDCEPGFAGMRLHDKKGREASARSGEGAPEGARPHRACGKPSTADKGG
ncbi:hypothetical protein FOL47_007328 [Perkinsus chesapeaki]|uniref:RNase H type-1 domain-containing protein n=1 Tax=Perkinsus chesapeaki TaxID=330153 RepID=A0A7J6MWK2_PERCH|nr:hypothetical protein FOL47_007328 [Perkinsus chesapeaki]